MKKNNDKSLMQKEHEQKQCQRSISLHLPSIVSNQPFYIPNDFQVNIQQQIFKLKDLQKQRKLREKNYNKNKKIWEKFKTKPNVITKHSIKEFCKSIQNQVDQLKFDISNKLVFEKTKTRQTMHKMIQKKKQMIYYQMVIDNKRQQISRFQNLSYLHKHGYFPLIRLQRSQKMLKDDIHSFNEQLNKKKNQTRNALKNSENKSKQRNQLANIIKQKKEINVDLFSKNIAKLQTLENLFKYKNFLDHLNPNKKIKNKQKSIVEKQISIDHYEFPISTETVEMLSQQNNDQNLYSFNSHEQFLNILINLQENNLSLIATTSEIEQISQQFKRKFEEVKENLEGKKNELFRQKNELFKMVEKINQQMERLKNIKSVQDISNVYMQLQNQINKTFRQNILEKKQAFQVLTQVEKKLEIQIAKIQEFRAKDNQRIKLLEKQCVFNKRRIKIDQQQGKMKTNKTIEQKIVRKKIGRPLMSRTMLQKKQICQQVKQEVPIQQIQRIKYLS